MVGEWDSFKKPRKCDKKSVSYIAVEPIKMDVQGFECKV